MKTGAASAADTHSRLLWEGNINTSLLSERSANLCPCSLFSPFLASFDDYSSDARITSGGLPGINVESRHLYITRAVVIVTVHVFSLLPFSCQFWRLPGLLAASPGCSCRVPLTSYHACADSDNISQYRTSLGKRPFDGGDRATADVIGLIHGGAWNAWRTPCLWPCPLPGIQIRMGIIQYHVMYKEMYWERILHLVDTQFFFFKCMLLGRI